MRILSQDGKIDVNYDLGNLSIASGRCEDVERASVYFHSCSCANAARLAEYTSLDKARKAMEMLRDNYKQGKIEEVYREGVYSYRMIFKFPKDSEIEENHDKSSLFRYIEKWFTSGSLMDTSLEQLRAIHGILVGGNEGE